LDMRIFACRMLEKGIGRVQKDTDSFKIPVCEIGTMNVFQTLRRPVQLVPRFSEGSDGESEVTYQLQSVHVINSNVVHDVPVLHPL